MSAPRRPRDDEKATRPLRPVAGADPNRHRVRVEVDVEVHTGMVNVMLVCNDCPQRALLMRRAVEGFHKPPPLEAPRLSRKVRRR